jgi:hypothetical protein
VNGIVHETFQQAALELNLVTDVTDALVCFQQSLGMATPYELRCLFVSLTVAGARTVNGIVHETFRQAALELNLVLDVTDALVCFQQSLGMASPYELQCLFVSLTVAGIA